MALQRVHQDRGRVHLAALDPERRALRLNREGTDVLFLDIAEKVAVFGALGGHKSAVGPHGEDLPDLFVERHFLEGLRDPAFAVGRKLRRGRRSGCARRFLCVARGSHQKESEQQEPATQFSHRVDSRIDACMSQIYIAFAPFA